MDESLGSWLLMKARTTGNFLVCCKRFVAPGINPQNLLTVPVVMEMVFTARGSFFGSKPQTTRISLGAEAGAEVRHDQPQTTQGRGTIQRSRFTTGKCSGIKFSTPIDRKICPHSSRGENKTICSELESTDVRSLGVRHIQCPNLTFDKEGENFSDQSGSSIFVRQKGHMPNKQKSRILSKSFIPSREKRRRTSSC